MDTVIFLMRFMDCPGKSVFKVQKTLPSAIESFMMDSLSFLSIFSKSFNCSICPFLYEIRNVILIRVAVTIHPIMDISCFDREEADSFLAFLEKVMDSMSNPKRSGEFD